MDVNDVSESMPDNIQHDERTSVLRQYASAAEHYAWTVAELERQRGNLSKHKYDQLYLAAEQARAECERLRRAMIALPPDGNSR
jgi:hypothetical protein